MVRGGIATLVATLAVGGCSKPETVSRVVLPPGSKPVKGLKPDPVIDSKAQTEAVESKLLAASRSQHGKSPIVDGVCRLSGTEIECWNPLGTLDPSLVKRARIAIQGVRGSLPNTPGKMNRLVLIYPATDPRWTLSRNERPDREVFRPIRLVGASFP